MSWLTGRAHERPGGSGPRRGRLVEDAIPRGYFASLPVAGREARFPASRGGGRRVRPQHPAARADIGRKLAVLRLRRSGTPVLAAAGRRRAPILRLTLGRDVRRLTPAGPDGRRRQSGLALEPRGSWNAGSRSVFVFVLTNAIQVVGIPRPRRRARWERWRSASARGNSTAGSWTTRRRLRPVSGHCRSAARGGARRCSRSGGARSYDSSAGDGQRAVAECDSRGGSSCSVRVWGATATWPAAWLLRRRRGSGGRRRSARDEQVVAAGRAGTWPPGPWPIARPSRRGRANGGSP